MSEHKPECWIVSHANPLNGCICTELRACEQRVLKDLVPNLQIADTQGFNRGLRQAREAVEGCRTDLRGYLDKTDALAAIDALRGES